MATMRVAEAAEAALDVARQLLRQLRREAERSHIEEWLAIDEPEIDPPRPARRDDAGGGVEVRRDPRVRARSFAVPIGRMPSGRPLSITPSAAALMVPSPPPTDDAVDLLALLDDERRQLLPAAAVPVDGFDPVRFQRVRRAAFELRRAVAALGVDDEKGAPGHRA